MNNLYYEGQQLPDLGDLDYIYGSSVPLQCKADDVSTGFTFDGQVLQRALKHIYEKDFHPMTEIEDNLFNETYRIFSKATNEGIIQSSAEVPDTFLRKLEQGNAVFSAFKVHRMQNDIAALLHDSEGVLKPFKQWKDDVHPMLDHHVNHWLRTEYNTAVIRSRQAADWQRFEQHADILPNLEWMPSTSVNPGADHVTYWGTILPLNHPFWNVHRPGDRWNCKCSLSATDEPPTGAPKNSENAKDLPAPGLDNNPGRDGKLFGDTHPYITNGYKGAKEAVKRYMAEKEGGKEKPITYDAKKEEIKAATKKAYEWVRENVPENGYTLPATKDKGTFELKVSRGSLKDVIDHFKTPRDKMVISELTDAIPKRIYTHSANLGEGKKGDPETVRRNLEKKRERGVKSYNYYDIVVNGETWELNCEVYKKGFEKPYALRQNKRAKQ